jgi:2'-5' RNA ligase
MSDRWFLALWPDAPARAALAAGAAGLIPPGARAADPRDLHLTLVFLGQLSTEALGAAVQAAGSVRAGPLVLRIDRAGYFPRARVLWCGPAEPRSELLGLHGQLSRALADRGIAIESRPYRPHITLARKVGRAPRQDWYPPVEWISGELVLARGLEGRVPRYEQWRRWPLVADATGGAVPAPDL